MINDLYDYQGAGFRFFGLHGVDSSGICGCGDPDCKTLFKHPVISRWQSVPPWSDDQIDMFKKMGWFNTGFGVLCKGWLIVDVDARNGGVPSFERLCADVPGVGQAAFVVATGSGGGSAHHYFKIDEQVAIAQHLDSYPGIDFKSSGYVVGAGSLHASGNRYETVRGFPQDITEAPTALIELLKKPERVRVSTDGGEVDIDQERIIDLLEYIDSAAPYEKWTAVGMAIHHCLGGSDAGLQIWINWTAKKQHDAQAYRLSAQNLYKRWHTFGKSGNPVGFGTLMQYAREGGYSDPVTFVYEGECVPESSDGGADDLPPADLKRPPGWVGELTAWINAQCLYPAESLAVAAALTAVSSIAGMRHEDSVDNISPNLMTFCIAGSGTGKDTVINAYLEIMAAAGCTPAIYGGIKSSQEIVRNFLEHQLAAYCYDEMGFFLSKLQNASKRGGALYLEEVIGLIMSAYSKPNGYLPISGDLKRETRDKLLLEAGRITKRIDGLPTDSSTEEKKRRMEADHERVMEAVNTIDMGIKSPFMTFIGFSNPEEFTHLMDGRMARNGFLARAVMFQELETNPKRKKNFRKRPMDAGMESAIQNLYAPGCYDLSGRDGGRIQHTGERTSVSSTMEAVEALDAAYERFHELAEKQKGATGLEAIPRRGYEMTAKVSMLLAIPSGVRTLEHVVWAEALAWRDCDSKIKMAVATERPNKADGVAARILNMLSVEHGETAGVICNRIKSKQIPSEAIRALLEQMEAGGALRSEVVTKGKHAGKGKKYFATAKGKDQLAD